MFNIINKRWLLNEHYTIKEVRVVVRVAQATLPAQLLTGEWMK